VTDDPLFEILRLLTRLPVPYMLTGSYASNLYGAIRSTFDADLVVSIDSKAMRRLVEALGSDFYLDAGTLEEARQAGDQFNAVHKRSGLKLDFYLLSKEEYSRTAFQRRRQERVGDDAVSVIAPEDLILAKLRWSRQGGSQRQVEDARGVYELQKERLDEGYLRRWARELELQDLLEQIGVR
jgi:hypothetical protein